MRAHVHGDRAHNSQEHAGREAHDRRRSECPHYIVEQSSDTGGKDRFLALFGMISLNHSHPAQRLREPAGDLGINLAALAKNRPDRREGLVERHRKAQQ